MNFSLQSLSVESVPEDVRTATQLLDRLHKDASLGVKLPGAKTVYRRLENDWAVMDPASSIVDGDKLYVSHGEPPTGV